MTKITTKTTMTIDYSDYNDCNNYNDYRDSDLDLDLDWGVVIYNQIVTWTAFAILVMFFLSEIICDMWFSDHFLDVSYCA